MSDIDIRLEEDGSRGRYAWTAPDGAEAELTYSNSGDGRLIADHTFVPSQHREKGIALKLVERLVADARANGDKIVPVCPYVAAQFRKHPDWADVLTKT